MRADYGARAIIDLAQHYGQGLTQTAEIAARQRIPESYLEQLLTTLRKAGMVRSVRGPAGGHELMRAPAELTLGDILDVLEGVSSPSAPPDDRATTAADVLQDVWRDIAAHYQRLIHQISIEQLVQRQAEREARSMYYI